MVMQLPTPELARRAKAVKLVVTDCDGVLTDAAVYYSALGEELKRFNFRDGMGVQRLREAGIATAIVTGEDSAIVTARANKLGIRHVYLGVKDKASLLSRVLADAVVGAGDVAYIGDDVNDLGIMRAVREAGLTATPADGVCEVKDVAHFSCSLPGGHGAFREFADWILRLRS